MNKKLGTVAILNCAVAVRKATFREVLQGTRLSLNGFSHHLFSQDSLAFSAILRVNGIRRSMAKNNRHYCDLNANQVCYAFRYVLSYFHNKNELTKLKPLISGRNFIFTYKLQYTLTSKMADFILLIWLQLFTN